MAQVEEITTLNIDGETYDVADLSEQVQKMVVIFNGWNQKEADATDELMMVKAAKADLSRQIILQVRNDMNPEEAEGEAEEAPPEEAATEEGAE